MASADLKLAGRYTAEAAPVWARAILEAFRAEDVKNLVYVPDQMLGSLFALAETDAFFRLIPVHREEEAVGVLAGLFLGRQRGAMVIQSSGLGNCLNALGALAIAGRIPFPMVVGLRGELGEFNPAQFPMGRAVPGCLTALGIQQVTLDDPDKVERIVGGALLSCYASEQPVGVLVSAQLTGWKKRPPR